jgi:adenylylsulfate kinase-like enzyme
MKKLYWFTGQAGAGKTVLAKLLKNHLVEFELSSRFTDELVFDFMESRNKYVIIDGDDIRAIYENKDYSIEGRKANVDFVQKLCSFLLKNGIIPIVCMVSPFAKQRQDFIDENNGVEIFVSTKEIRGREHYHVEYFEKPDVSRENVIVIDTTNSKDSESFARLYFKLSQLNNYYE